MYGEEELAELENRGDYTTGVHSNRNIAGAPGEEQPQVDEEQQQLDDQSMEYDEEQDELQDKAEDAEEQSVEEDAGDAEPEETTAETAEETFISSSLTKFPISSALVTPVPPLAAVIVSPIALLFNLVSAIMVVPPLVL